MQQFSMLEIYFVRPFERTITMQKDSTGHIGFVFKEGRITAIVKDSSAARNGVLTEHQLVEVNGQNVVGMKVRAGCVVRRGVRVRGGVTRGECEGWGREGWENKHGEGGARGPEDLRCPASTSL